MQKQQRQINKRTSDHRHNFARCTRNNHIVQHFGSGACKGSEYIVQVIENRRMCKHGASIHDIKAVFHKFFFRPETGFSKFGLSFDQIIQRLQF